MPDQELQSKGRGLQTYFKKLKGLVCPIVGHEVKRCSFVMQNATEKKVQIYTVHIYIYIYGQ